MQLHPEIAELADLLRNIEGHLTTHEATHWATLLGRCRACLEKSDAWGLRGFLAMFGGMGSLNDLVLQRDGRVLATENDELRAMLTKAWTLGTRLQHEELNTLATNGHSSLS